MQLCKGSRVLTSQGRGTVVDRAHGESLVRLDEGSKFDTTHGMWVCDESFAVIGFDPEAMVFTASRKVRAQDILPGWSMNPDLMTLEERVRRGAILLEEAWPTWRDEIDLDELNLSDMYNCVLGQVYGSFTAGTRALNIDSKGRDHEASYGFEVSRAEAEEDEYAAYDRLTLAWVEYLSE